MTFSLFSSGFLKLVFFFLFFYLKLCQGSWASKNFIICLVIKPASPIHISIPFPIPICQRLQCSRKDICVTRKFPMPATSRQHSHSHSHFILYFLFFEFFSSASAALNSQCCQVAVIGFCSGFSIFRIVLKHFQIYWQQSSELRTRNPNRTRHRIYESAESWRFRGATSKDKETVVILSSYTDYA